LTQHLPEIDRLLMQAMDWTTRSVLDVGCGVGHNGFLVWERESFLNWERSEDLVRAGSSPVPAIEKRFKVGLDGHVPYLKRAAELGVYDQLLKVDLRDGLPFDAQSFDTVVCTEVLEHLPEPHSCRLLEECERVARQLVLVSVPLGDHRRTHPGGNRLEDHHSVWTTKRLRNAGYIVQGFGLHTTIDRPASPRSAVEMAAGALLHKVRLPGAGLAIAHKHR
jgi:SAM-dependent methyltransferase